VRPYTIDGRAATGDDYVLAIDALPPDDDDIHIVSTKRSDGADLSVCVCSMGLHLVAVREDGSTWSSALISKDLAQEATRQFLLEDPAWHDVTSWEKVALGTREARRRKLLFLAIGLFLVALAAWLRLLSVA
jgi:hypothetical protein